MLRSAILTGIGSEGIMAAVMRDGLRLRVCALDAAARDRLRPAHPRRAADDVEDGSCLFRAGCCLACVCDRRLARAHCRG
eukprot:5236629-Pleurochrysis_carterae.AAC.2